MMRDRSSTSWIFACTHNIYIYIFIYRYKRKPNKKAKFGNNCVRDDSVELRETIKDVEYE